MTTTQSGLTGLLDTERIRADFPILSRRLDGDRPLVYLDSANTSQKPRQVIDAMAEHYALHNANVARAVHQLGAESTAAFEAARDTVAAFINAPSRDEVIFTKNSSEALNLVANTLAWARGELRHRRGRRGRHHRDGAPLQHRAVAAAHRAQRRDAALVRPHRRGSARPVEHRRADQRAHQGRLAWSGSPTCSARSTRSPRSPAVRTRSAPWSCSTPRRPCRSCRSTWSRRVPTSSPSPATRWSVRPASACSGAARDVLEALPPFLGGGEMIETVTMARSTYAPIPHKFEAGTPPIVQAVGLGAALDYLSGVGMDKIAAHEHAITAYALDQLQRGRRAHDPRPDRGGRPRGSDQLRARRRPPARRQPGARLARHRRPRRTPLRQAGARAVRRAVVDAGVVLPLHDAGRRSTRWSRR